jgi:putative heme-binding domain-containing protein
MNPFHKPAWPGFFLWSGCGFAIGADVAVNANRLTYLDSDDPFYVSKDFPKLTIPQWLGEPGVDAVVTLAIDDMADTARYTTVMNIMFSRLERTKALVQALEAGTIPSSQMAVMYRQQLLNSSDAEIRERAKKLFAASNADRQDVGATYQEVLQLKGNSEHGAEVFRANCALCHKLKGEGNAVGPDLSTVSDKPASELITSILDPNRIIEATFVSYNVLMKDGRELTGVIATETPNTITLRMPGSPEQVILRKDLEKLTSNTLSLMCEGFESVIRQQDMAYLIAYITSAAPLKAAK